MKSYSHISFEEDNDGNKVIKINLVYYVSLDNREKIDIITPTKEEIDYMKPAHFSIETDINPDIRYLGLVFVSDSELDALEAIKDLDDVIVYINSDQMIVDENDKVVMISKTGKVFNYNNVTEFQFDRFESPELLDTYLQALSKSILSDME